jgi:VWFA-related protein
MACTISAQEKTQPKFSVRVELVSLDAEVLDKQGNPVTDLKVEDFAVQENGKEMKITHFARLKDRPVTLAIVLDNLLPREQLRIGRQYVMQLIHTLARGDEICLYTFDEEDAYLEQDLTTDRTSLLDALQNIDVAPRGLKGFWKKLYGATPRTGLGIDAALQNLKQGRNAKRAVLVISNRFEGLGPATVEHVQESGFTLLTLAFENKTNGWPVLGGLQLKADRFYILGVDLDQILSRKSITKQSGGRKFSVSDEDIAGTCKSITYALKNHYSLGYPTQVIGTGRQKPRKVEVLVPGKKDYRVHARRSYTPPP